jgi:hypothetical protein
MTNIAEAQSSQQVLLEDVVFRSTLREVPFTSYFDAPIAHYKFPALSEDQKASLASFGLEEDKARSTFSGIIQPHHYSEVIKMGARDATQVPGTCNRSGFGAYISCGRAMRLFSFVSIMARSARNQVVRYDTMNTGTIGDGPIPYLIDSKESLTVGAPMNNTSIASLKFGPIFIPYKKMTPIPSYDCSPATPISQEGLVFPYFHGLLSTDRDFVIPIFQRLFYRCLGDSPEKANSTWGLIKTGIRNLSMTRAGLAISHAFLGMMLADNGQCGIRFVISNHSYKGFVLVGAAFQVIMNNRIHLPVTSTEVSKALQRISRHEVALQKIVDIVRIPYLSKTQEDGTILQPPRYDIQITDINTSRKFWAFFQKIDMDWFPSEESKKIIDLTAELKFGARYASVSRASLFVFLNYVLTGNMDSLKDHDTYISPSTIFATDRVLNGLCIFGPSCPSVSYGSAKERSTAIVKDDKDDEVLKKQDGKWEFELPYKMIPIHEAVNQWNHLFIHGNIYVPLPRPDKREFSNQKLRSGNFKNEEGIQLYKLIKDVVNRNREANKGKRKEAPKEAGGIRKKQAKGQAYDMNLDF